MKFGIVPRYIDLFEEPIPELTQLLEGISSNIIVGLTTMIHAELHLVSNNISSQDRILKLFLQRQSADLQLSFLRKLSKGKRNNDDEYALFSMSYVMDFMHYALITYREFPMTGGDTSPEQDYLLLKAYVVFIERRNEKDSQIYDQNRDHSDDFFFKHTLPILSGQFEANRLLNPFTEMVRGLVFFNYLQFSSRYGELVKSFLIKRGYSSSWNYVSTMTSIIQSSWGTIEHNGQKSARYSITVQKEFEDLFKNFTIDIAFYKENYSEDHRNFSGIKDKPLFKYDDSTYVVLNWNFFASKLYEGLLYDFYYNSGIIEASPFKSFPNFKQYIGEEVTEKFLFKKLLTEAFQKKHSVLLFDDKERDGFPDAYYREGNDVILFEVKDAYFQAKGIDTIDYSNIKEAIDNKYNRDNKGTGQLAAQLLKMLTKPFESHQNNKNVKNLTIYPVMIYTDYFFSMPGINNYLQLEFDKRIDTLKLRDKYKNIKPLVFINIRFFINHIDLISQRETDLLTLFTIFYKDQIRANKKVKRTDDLSAFFDCYKTFETVVFETYKGIMYKRENYIKRLVESLELSKGLPEGDSF
jgi:hypothetical protein